ncbi:MAG: hypothetical protein GF331_02190 [Chitinivibrionales bacterium]|nr:hypothetical protein [Chitinivibrionales bacterium]
MCGRFVRHRSPRMLADELGVPVVQCDLGPSYNVAPRQPVAVVLEDGRKKLVTMQWGLIPSWARDDTIGNKLINARCETVAEKPSFRASFRSRRCLIPADGFYEWTQAGGRKVPVYVQLGDGAPFCMAGLYDTWVAPDGEQRTTCAIITTEANGFMRSIHSRMPVIVPPHDHDRWLDPATDRAELTRIMRPFDGALRATPVSTRVNTPLYNAPDCIEPAGSD